MRPRVLDTSLAGIKLRFGLHGGNVLPQLCLCSFAGVDEHQRQATRVMCLTLLRAHIDPRKGRSGVMGSAPDGSALQSTCMTITHAWPHAIFICVCAHVLFAQVCQTVGNCAACRH